MVCGLERSAGLGRLRPPLIDGAIVHVGEGLLRSSVPIFGELISDGVAAIVEPASEKAQLFDRWVANASHDAPRDPGPSRFRGRQVGAATSTKGPRSVGQGRGDSEQLRVVPTSVPGRSSTRCDRRRHPRDSIETSGAPLRAASSWSGSATRSRCRPATGRAKAMGKFRRRPAKYVGDQQPDAGGGVG